MRSLVLAIPTYNRPDRIGKLFDCLKSQNDLDFSVVILNDGANQDTKKIFATQNSTIQLHYIESQNPSGLPLARNKILDYIEENDTINDDNARYVAFLDDDLIVERDFIEQIKKYSEKLDVFCFNMIQTGPSTTFSLTGSPLLQKLFSPIIGTIIPFLGIVFGGFYIKTHTIRQVDHIIGCCIIYNFSKNKKARFDPNLNEGNFVAEDTCFTHGLKKSGNKLYYVGTYTFIHDSAPTGGSRIENKTKSFFWYWKHKLYIIKKYYGTYVFVSAVCFSFIESILLSLIFKKNLTKEFFLATQNINKFLGK